MKLSQLQIELQVDMTDAVSKMLQEELRKLAQSGTTSSDAKLLTKLLSAQRLLAVLDTASNLAEQEPQVTLLLSKASNARVVNGEGTYRQELTKRVRDLQSQARKRGLVDVTGTPGEDQLRQAIQDVSLGLTDEISRDLSFFFSHARELNTPGNTSKDNSRIRKTLAKLKQKIIKKVDVMESIGPAQIDQTKLFSLEHGEIELSKLFAREHHPAASATSLTAMNKKRLVDAYESLQRTHEEADQLNRALVNHIAYYVLAYEIGVSRRI